MTQGFDYSKLTGKLYEIAQMADNNGNGEARNNGKLEEKELSIFEASAKRYLGTEGYDYTQDDINAVLGFNKSTPAVTTNPIDVTKKEAKRDKEAVKDTVKDLVKQGVAPQDLVKVLKEMYSQPQFAEDIKEVEYVLNIVSSTNYNSKENVENIHKQAKAKLKADEKWDSFHKDLLDSIEEQAKNNQINKEFEKMVEVYNQIKETLTAQGKAQNFEEYYKLTKGKFDKKESYTKEALKKLEEFVKDDARSVVKDRMEDTTSTGKMGIRKELRKQAGKEDFQKDAIQDMKTERKIFAREHKYEKNAEKLEHLSRADVEKKLGTKMVDLLKRSYLAKLQNEDGTYDLSKLGDEILTRVGADYKVNQSTDLPMAEMENIRTHLADLANVSKDDISNGDVKDMLSLFKIKREHKDRTPGLVKAAVGGIGGALSALASSRKMHQSQVINITFDTADLAAATLKDLDADNIKYTKTLLPSGKVHVKIAQEQTLNPRLMDTLKGAGIGVLTSAAMDILFGQTRDEKSCMSVSDYDKNDPTYTDPVKYKKHFANTTKSQAKIKAMNALVDAYVEKYGNNWHSELHQVILDAAGIGSKLNPEECRMLKFKKPVEPQAQTPSTNPDAPADKPPQDTTNPDPNSETVCNVETWSDTVDKTVVHKRRGGDTWGGIVKAYYPCLVQEKGLSGAIRALKTALATDENGNIDRATYQALLRGGDLPKTMKLPARIGDCDINKDATVKRVKVHGNGKARIQSVGRDSKETTWTAQDCHNKTAYGKTEAEARENLKKANK